METNEAVQLWKERNIQRCEMEFNAGGDDMGDCIFIFYGENDVEVKNNDDLEDFFVDKVFKQVVFYIDNEGEYGTVYITLDNEDETLFIYKKTSWTDEQETMEEPSDIELTPEEVALLRDKIERFIFTSDEPPVYTYYKDCILFEKEMETLNAFKERVSEYAEAYEFATSHDSCDDCWWRVGLSESGRDGNILTLNISGNFYVTHENDN
jgi:hypothetical protein